MLSYLENDPLTYVFIVVIVIASITLHELAHAHIATAQGDPTPRLHGRLTFNPLAHIQGMVIVLILILGFAWATTPVEPRFFRERRRGEVKVAFAGPAVNLILAACGALAFVLLAEVAPPAAGEPVSRGLQFWWLVGQFNFALFFLNLIPVPPFDGFTVLFKSISAGHVEAQLRRAQPIPMFAALALVIFGPFWDLVDTALAAVIHAFRVPFLL